MSRQDKATSERHTKMLRELVKKPDNKLCADCKRNDPRWASWNLGVFLCIRCSGIHRGMGTHISKVKSVDLDVWTPEQMESIQRWGNHRANLYWEAHLKPGHIPPEHKMESFVRSKYESRRWALEGSPPRDPSILEDGSVPIPSAPARTAQSSPPPITQSARATHTLSSNFSARRPASPAQITNRQPQPHRLLSAAVADRNQHARAPIAVRPVAPPESGKSPEQQAPSDDLFSLDFHAPSPALPPSDVASSSRPKKDVKQDILSLFSAPAATAPQPPPAFGQFGAEQQNAWGQFTSAPAPQQQSTSMIGSNGTGAWGTSSGWTAPAIPPAQGNLWGNPAPVQQSGLFGSGNPWGASAGASNARSGGDLFSAPFGGTAQKKDDAFGDLWGGFT